MACLDLIGTMVKHSTPMRTSFLLYLGPTCLPSVPRITPNVYDDSAVLIAALRCFLILKTITQKGVVSKRHSFMSAK